MSRLCEFALCPLPEIREFVMLNHYARNFPCGVSHCFSARMEGILVGAAVFGYKAGQAKTGSIFMPPFDGPVESRELMRLVMAQELPHNSESKFVGWCLRWLEKNTNILGLLSYADPEHGHDGCIYRAGNWLYTGMSRPNRTLIVDGVEKHQRQATALFGNCSSVRLRQMGHEVEVHATSPKHRYVYIFDDGMLPFVKYPILKFTATIEDAA
jgi:hypothetical protein